MRIALTGANGFAGSIIRKGLVEAGHEVIKAWSYLEHYKSPNVECLIHCARHHENIIPPITQDKWRAELETDVTSAYNYSIYMAKENPQLLNIIIITSVYGETLPTVRWIPPNYLAAKAAERYMVKILAQELAPKTRVNGIAYGGILSDRPAADQTPEFRKAYEAKTLVGHMVLPDEVAGPVLFLVSEASKGMTGAIIPVDGGYGLR